MSASNLSASDTVRLENLEARLSDLEALAKRIDPAVLLAVPEPVTEAVEPRPATLLSLPPSTDANLTADERLARIKALLGL